MKHMIDILAATTEGGTGIFKIDGGETDDLFLKNNLITSLILTQIHKPYHAAAYMNLGYLQDWPKEELRKTHNYTIN